MTWKQYITTTEYEDIIGTGTCTDKEIQVASEYIDYVITPNLIDINAVSDNVKKSVAYQIKYWQDNGNLDEIISQAGSVGLGSLSVNLSQEDADNTDKKNLSPITRRYLFLDGLLYRGVIG